MGVRESDDLAGGDVADARVVVSSVDAMSIARDKQHSFKQSQIDCGCVYLALVWSLRRRGVY